MSNLTEKEVYNKFLEAFNDLMVEHSEDLKQIEQEEYELFKEQNRIFAMDLEEKMSYFLSNNTLLTKENSDYYYNTFFTIYFSENKKNYFLDEMTENQIKLLYNTDSEYLLDVLPYRKRLLQTINIRDIFKNKHKEKYSVLINYFKNLPEEERNQQSYFLNDLIQEQNFEELNNVLKINNSSDLFEKKKIEVIVKINGIDMILKSTSMYFLENEEDFKNYFSLIQKNNDTNTMSIIIKELQEGGFYVI